ncbi:hypothetical protein KIPB_013655, partial [Kipferlia bialata]|eukprot:g13655.t1
MYSDVSGVAFWFVNDNKLSFSPVMLPIVSACIGILLKMSMSMENANLTLILLSILMAAPAFSQLTAVMEPSVPTAIASPVSFLLSMHPSAVPELVHLAVVGTPLAYTLFVSCLLCESDDLVAFLLSVSVGVIIGSLIASHNPVHPVPFLPRPVLFIIGGILYGLPLDSYIHLAVGGLLLGAGTGLYLPSLFAPVTRRLRIAGPSSLEGLVGIYVAVALLGVSVGIVARYVYEVMDTDSLTDSLTDVLALSPGMLTLFFTLLPIHIRGPAPTTSNPEAVKARMLNRQLSFGSLLNEDSDIKREESESEVNPSKPEESVDWVVLSPHEKEAHEESQSQMEDAPVVDVDVVEPVDETPLSPPMPVSSIVDTHAVAVFTELSQSEE